MCWSHQFFYAFYDIWGRVKKSERLFRLKAMEQIFARQFRSLLVINLNHPMARKQIVVKLRDKFFHVDVRNYADRSRMFATVAEC